LDIQTISIALGDIGLFIAAINSIISRRKVDQQRQLARRGIDETTKT
jgi:hypothetical protein